MPGPPALQCCPGPANPSRRPPVPRRPPMRRPPANRYRPLLASAVRRRVRLAARAARPAPEPVVHRGPVAVGADSAPGDQGRLQARVRAPTEPVAVVAEPEDPVDFPVPPEPVVPRGPAGRRGGAEGFANRGRLQTRAAPHPTPAPQRRGARSSGDHSLHPRRARPSTKATSSWSAVRPPRSWDQSSTDRARTLCVSCCSRARWSRPPNRCPTR